MHHTRRPCVTVAAALVGAGLVVAPTPAPVGAQIITAAIKLTGGPDDIAYIMGGSGHPIPPQDYLTGVNTEYIQALYPGYTPEPLFYPAGASGGYTPPESLPYDVSAGQGLTILNDTIMRNINDGNTMVIFGHSQSSSISSMEMTNLAAGNTGGLGPAPTADQLHFVMTGNPSNPDGGYLSRFPGLQLTAEGTTSGAFTPPDTIYHTDIYTIEYEGVGDFPRYPIDLIADLNAVAGMQYLHPYANYINPDNVDNAFLLPGSADLPGGEGATNYWMIPTDNLPMLIPLRGEGAVGNALADLVQPDLKVLVNLGYGSIDQGWDTGPANVETPFGLFPNVAPSAVLDALQQGAAQGVQAFQADMAGVTGADWSDLAKHVFEPTSLVDAAPGIEGTPTQILTDIVHTFTSTMTTASSYLLPMSAIADDELTSLPVYGLQLFTQNVQAGDLLNALGLPLAATIGQSTLLASGFNGDVEAIAITVGNGFGHIVNDLTNLF